MMRLSVSIVRIGAILAVLGAIAFAADQPSQEATRSVSRFSGVVTTAALGGNAPMRVEIMDWYLARTPQGFQIPAQGFYLAQLRSGRVVTDIAGKSETRQAGDLWTVPAGVPMTVTIRRPGEGAQLQTIAINPGP
jgi:hypothetical protein